MGLAQKKTINVCGASGRKRTKVKVLNTKESPNEDYNNDGIFGGSFFYGKTSGQMETFFSETITAADALWAQACVAVEDAGITPFSHP